MLLASDAEDLCVISVEEKMACDAYDVQKSACFLVNDSMYCTESRGVRRARRLLSSSSFIDLQGISILNVNSDRAKHVNDTESAPSNGQRWSSGRKKMAGMEDAWSSENQPKLEAQRKRTQRPKKPGCPREVD